MLWIDAHGLARRESKECRVKSGDLVELEKTAPACIELARSRRIGIEDAVEIEAVGGDLADRVDTIMKQTPELFWSIRATREAAADAYDSDCVVSQDSTCSIA